MYKQNETFNKEIETLQTKTKKQKRNPRTETYILQAWPEEFNRELQS